MKNNIVLALISALTLSAHFAFARETVISTRISTGVDYSDRTYDDDESEDMPPPPDIGSTEIPEDSTELPPPDMADSRDDERAGIVISPSIRIFSEGASDSAMLEYAPRVNYDLIEGESNDINHDASVGFKRDLTDIWDVKIYDSFKNTDEYETNRPQEESLSDSFVEEELTASIPSMDGMLRDDFGRRRYTRNELSISSGLNYLGENRISLGYGWDHLEYDEDETSSDTYEDYDKYNVSLAVSHELNSLWTVKGYTQYVRGVYDTDDASDNDLDEYHLGTILETDIIQAHPITLLYDFSQTNYDDDSIDSTQTHKMTLGYQLISSRLFDMNFGAGPTYTKLNDSKDSWSANGNLNMGYKLARGSIRLTSELGTQLDNFSGTDERGLTDYWLSRVEYNYPVSRSLRTSLYGSYRDETRDEVNSDSEIDVEQTSVGGVLKYSINDSYDVGLNYDYTMQDSERTGDSYDEHRAVLMFSYKTDLFSW